MRQSRSVVAYILTFDDPEALRACVEAVRRQDPGPIEIVVIDNASEPPATVVSAPESATGDLPVRILRSAENVGPAGGHANGLDDFLHATDADFAWVFDDDVTPDAGCLAALLEVAAASADGAVFPRQLGPDGQPDDHPRWAGVLLPRRAVAAVGVPNSELFWWTEDTEYLAHRLPRAGFPMTTAPETSAARVHHAASRRTDRRPDWKLYYETRNTIYYRLYTQRGRRAWKIARYLARTFVRIAKQPAPRRSRLAMVGKGVMDGLRGRLGKTIDPPREPGAERSTSP